MNYYFKEQHQDELYHYGVKGMKWGVRKQIDHVPRQRRQTIDTNRQTIEKSRQARKARLRKAATIGAAVTVTALAAYGGYKVAKIRSNNRTSVETWLLKNGASSFDRFADGRYRNRTVKRSNTLLGPRLDIDDDYGKIGRSSIVFEDRNKYRVGSKARPIRRSSRYI